MIHLPKRLEQRVPRRTRPRGLVLGAVMVAGGLAGSGFPAASASAATNVVRVAALHANHTYRIVFVAGTVADPFFVTMYNGMRAEARKLGASVNWQGPSSYQPSLQVPILESVIARHPDFLFISPTDDKALIAPLEQVIKAHIPDMTLDSDVLNKSVRLGNITSDDTLGGVDAAKVLAGALGGHGEVAVFNDPPGILPTDQRQAGFQEGIRKFPGITSVGVWHNNDDPTTAAAQVSGVLTRYPKLDGIFGTDDFQGAGAAIAAASAKRHMKIVAFDAEPEQVTDLKRGLLYALIVQKSYYEGQLAIQYAVKYLNGDHSAIPAETMLPFVIATRANIDSPSVAPYLYSDHLS